MLDAYPIWTVPPDRRVEVPHHSARVAPWHAQIDTIVLHYTADPPTTATPPRAIRWWLSCKVCAEGHDHPVHHGASGIIKTKVGALAAHAFKAVKTSAHYVVERAAAVWQCVPWDRMAWGVTTPGISARAIEIEIANAGWLVPGDRVGTYQTAQGHAVAGELDDEGRPWEPFPEVQIAAVVDLINTIRGGLHPRGGWRLVGHSDVQSNKTDPGPLFPWGSMPLPRTS